MEATAARAVYVLVGLAAVLELVGHKGNCKACEMKSGGSMPMGAGM
jgi:uncharacterized membrane protein YuzA (DUF378 family)